MPSWHTSSIENGAREGSAADGALRRSRPRFMRGRRVPILPEARRCVKRDFFNSLFLFVLMNA